MTSSARNTRSLPGAAPSKPVSASSSRPSTARPGVRSTRNQPPRDTLDIPLPVPLKTRAVPSRFLASSTSSLATPPRPSLDSLTEFYTSLYTLGTLRRAASDSEDAFARTMRTLEREVDALEKEVGQTWERREVQSELEVLTELEKADGELLKTLERLADCLGRSGRVLDQLEGRELSSRDGRDAIYPLQDMLAQCATRLRNADTTGFPRIRELKVSLLSITDLRRQVLAATRQALEDRLANERVESRAAIERMLAT